MERVMTDRAGGNRFYPRGKRSRHLYLGHIKGSRVMGLRFQHAAEKPEGHVFYLEGHY